MRIYKYKTIKLALRSLVDDARQKVWREATEAPWFDKKAVTSWMAGNRADGQSVASWSLRVRALDTFYAQSDPSWRDLLGLDKDMFATINASEYGKVLCAAAHEFTAAEKESAVMAMHPELSGMYRTVLDFVNSIQLQQGGIPREPVAETSG